LVGCAFPDACEASLVADDDDDDDDDDDELDPYSGTETPTFPPRGWSGYEEGLLTK
jgi:hypothetical protein